MSDTVVDPESIGGSAAGPATTSRKVGLTVSIVSYLSAERGLSDTLLSLALAAEAASGILQLPVRVALVDNSGGGRDRDRLQTMIDQLQRQWLAVLDVRLLVAASNLGYGGGNNLAQASMRPAPADMSGTLALILNPDVFVEESALLNSLVQMRRNPACALLVPRALDEHGQDLHLAHRHPSPAVFALRAGQGLFPERRQEMLQRYEIRDIDACTPHRETVCASGCFMLVKWTIWDQLNGFDDRYFLYFEDYDLSSRARRLGTIDYCPDVRIRHFGGGAAVKGWRHRWLFARSAWRFFNQHGWRPGRHQSNSVPSGQ